MPNQTSLLYAVAIDSPAADVVMIEEALAASDFTPSSYTSKETGRAITYLIGDDEQDAREKCRLAGACLEGWKDLLSATPSIDVRLIQKEDWAESWKKHFHTFRATNRIVVRPSWEEYTPLPGDLVLSLDPGMCFGTGYHGTTRACLTYLDKLQAAHGRLSFIDAGTGSGILAIGARLLGYQPVYAFDNDPQCIDTTCENLQKAGLDGVAPVHAALGEYVPPQPCNVVAANILATVLLAQAEDVIALVDRNSSPAYLILSGILIEQYPAVLERYSALGAVEISRRTLQEWTSGCFRIPPSHP